MQKWIGLIVILLTLPSSVFARVYARTIADTTQIWDTGIEWSCSGRFFAITRMSGDTIYVTERDTAQVATCLCYFDVCTKVTGLQPGTYTAVVTRRHEVRFLDSVHVYEEDAGSVTFSISNPTSITYRATSTQSGCHSTPESVPMPSAVPVETLLLVAYPNPFNPNTVVRYGIPRAGEVSLSVYTIAGQHIATLVSGREEAGSYEVIFDSESLASGIYVCRLTCDGLIVSRKMVLTR
jgi:hypothetical protein